MVMCTSSCRGPERTQDNTCNEETLEWSCICAAGTTKAFNDWQYPILFKLCRMDQLTCLHACPKRGMSALGQEATEGNLKGSRLQQQQQSRLSFPLEASDHMDGDDDDDDDDFDQDDVDAIEDFYIAIQGLRRTLILDLKRKGIRKALLTKRRSNFTNNYGLGNETRLRRATLLLFSTQLHVVILPACYVVKMNMPVGQRLHQRIKVSSIFPAI
ncbi:hypothetical protein BGX34_002794 [Mortierella sp. NVP85]|nr:hypothetical protein BGX34_002794 [Mortierella sp. NVP85]